MEKYQTLKNEVIMAEPVESCESYQRVMIVQDAAGQRHVVRKQHTGKQQEIRKQPTRRRLYITSKVEVTDREGKVTLYPSARIASDKLMLDYRTVHYHCRLGRAVKSGRFKGYRFRKVG